VTNCLENLEMSGNLTAVREVSGKKILSAKSGIKLFVVSCILAASILDFAGIVLFILVWIMHCCIPAPPLTITLVLA